MAFSDLEERKYKHFPEQHHAGARPNIAQKPYGASSRGDSLRSRDQLLWVVMFVSVVITYYPSH